MEIWAPVGKDIFNLNHAMVFFHNLFYDGQPESRAFELGGNVGFKRVRSDVIGEAPAIVAQAKAYSILYHFRTHGDDRFRNISQRILSILQKIRWV